MTDVSENLSVLRLEQGELVYWRTGADSPQSLSDGAGTPSARVLAIPAESVRLLLIDVSGAEAQHIAKSLPFLLEEDVVDDIDNLHFAYVESTDGQYAVAVTERERLQAISDELPAGQEPRHWIPEPMLLPWQPGERVLLVEGERALLRWGEFAGTAVPLAWLDVITRTLPDLAEPWTVYGNDDDVDRLRAKLPADVAIDHRRGHFGSALMLADWPVRLLDLRQGQFAPRLPLARWWQLWRTVAIAAGIAVFLQLGSDLLQWQRLKAENLALREAIQASYRRANPRGAVVDVEKQLDRQLASSRGQGAEGQPFSPLLITVVREVAAQGSVDLSTLNYSSTGDLRISMEAPDFATVESLRERLTAAGLTATLEGTSARGAGVAARLLVARS